MSRIGKKSIIIPQGVEAKIESGVFSVKGPRGELKKEIPSEVKVEINEGKITVSPIGNSKRVKSMWGSYRAFFFNMIKGVVDGYETRLQLEGVGFKANLEGEDLVLNVGFSNAIKMKKNPDIKFAIEKNIIIVSGINKELVGQVAANIKKVRVPDAYKGKGIRYFGEIIRKKAGKKAVAAGGT